MSSSGYRAASKAVGADPTMGWTVLQLIRVWQLECEARANLMIPQKSGVAETPEIALGRCERMVKLYVTETHHAVLKRSEVLHKVFTLIDKDKDGFLKLHELNAFMVAFFWIRIQAVYRGAVSEALSED